MNEEAQKAARLIGLYNGDPGAAMSLAVCYARGTNGYEKNSETAYKYLQQASSLGDPMALDGMRRIYTGEEVLGIKKKENLDIAVKMACTLMYIDECVDFTQFKNSAFHQSTEQEIQSYKRSAKAWLGWVYMCNENFHKRYLGYIFSLDMAENYGMPISLYALGWWYENVEHDSMEALTWLRRCGTSDGDYWGRSAAELYNDIAEELNRYRDNNSQIPYFDI